MKKRKIRNALIIYYVHNYNTLHEVARVLKKHDIRFSCVRRGALRTGIFRNKDLVISVGGDGTFLKVAQFSGRIPVLCVSSDPNHNEGFFARAYKKDFDSKIKRILKGRYQISKLMRLQGVINKKLKLPLAVNEIFIGSREPYHTSRYTLQIGNKKEFQKSSGVIISTPAGSYAWAKSAGSKRLPLKSQKYLYVVREPYFGRLTKPKLIKGVLQPSQIVRVTSHIHRGVAIVDSLHKEHKFCDSDILEVKVSGSPLSIIEFTPS